MISDLPPQGSSSPPEAPPSFVKQAMRNMRRKGRQSLVHFGITAMGCLGFIVLIAWLGRPTLPH